MNEKKDQRSISSDVYDEDYFLSHVAGHEKIKNIEDLEVILKHRERAFGLADIQQGQKVLDIGCGRGEIVLKSLFSGATAVGIDYSRASMSIAKLLIKKHAPQKMSDSISLVRAGAAELPFRDHSIDRIFCLSVVEHLNDVELKNCLKESYRILKTGGRLIITTSPNTWVYRFGYRLTLIPRMIMKKKLLPWTKDRGVEWRKYHVNEQNVLSLSRYLKGAGFRCCVWPFPGNPYHGDSGVKRILFPLFCEMRPLSYIFCNTLFAVGIKE